jgi:hypothetical protein
MHFAAEHPAIIPAAFITIGFIVIATVASIVLTRETH